MTKRLAAYLVHFYTASTLFFIVLSIHWLFEGRLHSSLVAMAIPILIDATDGMLARRYRVKELAAAVDGELLDNIVDFLSYVVLPMLFMMQTDMLGAMVVPCVSFVFFASAFGFSRTTAKLADQGFFVGFPSYWNIVVFYLYLLQTPASMNATLLSVLACLVFVPLRFLYISRLKKWRALHFVLGTLCAVFALLALANPPGELRTLFSSLSLLYVAFYTFHSFQKDLASRRPDWLLRLLKL